MKQLLKTTKEDRKYMLRDHEKAIKAYESEIKELKSQVDDIKKTARKLSDENEEKLDRRKAVDKKIGLIKAAGNALFVLGLVGLGIAAILIFVVGGAWPIVGGVAAALAGVAAIVFGFIVRPKWKKHAQEQNEAYKALEAYDRIQKGYSQHIQSLQTEINEQKARIAEKEAAIDKIEEFEKYETYYRWLDSAEYGHIVIMVTGNTNSLDGKPTGPKDGKKYKDSVDVVTGVEISLDKTPCCIATPANLDKQSGAFCIVPIEGGSTQKLQVRISYRSEDSTLERIGDPVAVMHDEPSTYLWYHVFAGKKGNQVYTNTYKDFEEFREATALTKEDVIKAILEDRD